MNLSTESLTIFGILIPGFVSSTILSMVVVRKPKDALSRVIEALVFSFLIYAFIVGICRMSPVIQAQARLPESISDLRLVNPYFLLAALATSFVLPLLFGFIANHDLHMKFFRKIKVTHRSARLSIWLDVFMDQKRYVICNLTGGRRIFGWPMYYSDDADKPLVYLYDPAWVNDDGTYTDLSIHGLLLVEHGSIESIEFTNVTQDNARLRQNPRRPQDQGERND